MERAMKVMQWLATVALVVAGLMLLMKPVRAQGTAAKASSLTAGPTRFTVVDEGTVGKPDVVLIPGLGSARAVWEAEAKLLAPNYRLHLVQVNGFAGAAAGANATGPVLAPIVEELHGYIAAAGIHPVVVGHSLGGLLALMLADRYPGDARKLVIVDTLPYYAVLFNPAATVDTVKPMAEAMKTQILATPADQFALMQQTVVPQLVNDKAAQAAVEAADIAGDRRVFAEAMYEDLLTDLRAEVVKIQTPALVLFAVDSNAKQPDPVAYEAMVRDAYKAMPNVMLVKVEPSKHFIMYDQPGKMDAAVEGFLR
jgi:pimeloyl-ACP methyl ester carboxylesterase